MTRGRWQRYWFADGGRLAAAIVRVGIATAALLTLYRLATLSTVQLPGPTSLYRPVGIWMLLGRTVPPDAVITLLWVLAWSASVAMLLGLASRIATAVSFLAVVSLVSLSFASTATWSHQYNVVLLAHCAFLGARGGDTLSADAVLRRLRGLPPIEVPRGYQWSLRLVQLAVALMFSGAVFHKILHGHGTLRWALSDNLRHHLLVRYDLTGLPRPPLVDWLIDDVWRYRTAALLNLISQLAPIFAVVFVRRPLVRLTAGMFFVIETLALGFIVTLWNEHWLPLAAAFVDWDALAAWFARRRGRTVASPPAPSASWQPPRAAAVFIVTFFVYELVTSFIPTLDQRLNTYPFSSFPMFATIRATRPYDQHLPYDLPGDRYVVTADHGLTPAAQRWFDHGNRWLYDVRDPDKLHARLAAILATSQQRYPDHRIRALRHYLTIFEAPAYPAPARLDAHPIAITGEIREDGSFRSLLGRLDATSVTLVPHDLDITKVRLVYYRDDHPTPIELHATRTGDRFELGTLAGDSLSIVAIVDGTPWLVARRSASRL